MMLQNKELPFCNYTFMDEAEYCNRVSIMVDGKIAAIDSPENLKKVFKPKPWTKYFIN